jgi:hypothetical protein
MTGFKYRCLLSNNCRTNVPSNEAILTVKAATAITSQPQNLILCDTNSGTIRVTVAGENLTYKWQVNAGGNTSFADLASPDALTSAIQLTTGNFANGSTYRCLITGLCGVAVSDNAVVGQSIPTSITTNPSDQTSCGGSVTFTAAALASNPSYRWSYSTDGGLNFAPVPTGAPFSGESTASLTIAPASSSVGHQFRVQVQGDCGAGQVSNIGTVKEISVPNIVTGSVTDGLNDEFPNMKGCVMENFELKIYNRWGSLTFSSTDATETWKSPTAPAGTYYYHLQYTSGGTQVAKKGTVELVK